jgi:hypothetical protein
MPLDLLAPQGAQQQLRDNYIHQMRQTIDAYLPSFIFVGEALQNALDAVRTASSTPNGGHVINITLNFNQRRVTVTDTGDGFPDAPNLLFLGGGRKDGLKLAGMIGVGLKVILFSSDSFILRSRRDDGSIRVDLVGACNFDENAELSIELPDPQHLPADNDPLESRGTSISYTFPDCGDGDGIPERYLQDVLDNCMSPTKPDFEVSLNNAIHNGGFPNRLAALIASDLRRYSYLGSTSIENEFNNVTVNLTVIGNDASLGPTAAKYADGQTEVALTVTPKYLTVFDTLAWAVPPKPVIVNSPLGEGGSNLVKAESQFNVTTYTRADEFELLLTDKRGRPSPELDRFQRLLFPKIRSITLTIGRIPNFRIYLPGGPRHVISARGVITKHDIDIYSGRNQQYVRTFDMVVDVDANLNYGKTQLSDTHLVANVRLFINEAYRATIHNAAEHLVGKIKDDEPTEDKFWQRPDLGVEELREKKVPRDENDVIALLFELVGMGHFLEFDWFGLSSRDTYDCRAYYRADGAPAEASSQTDLKVIEFKLNGAKIARDFDTDDDKDIRRVDLIICYDIGESPVPSYQVVPLEQSDFHRSDKSAYPGVTHLLYDTGSGREVQMLPLRDYVRQHYPPAEPAPLPDDIEETD